MTLLLSLACYITEADVTERLAEINGVDTGDTSATSSSISVSGSIEIPSGSAYAPGPVQVGLAAFVISDGVVVHDPVVLQLVDGALPAGVSRPFDFELALSDLDDGWFYEVNQEWPGTETATLTLVSWVDRNEDGQWEQGERLLGCNTEQVLVYVRGELPPGDIFPNEGWYRLTLDISIDGWAVADAFAIQDGDSLNAVPNLLPNTNREAGIEVRGPATATAGSAPTLALVAVGQLEDLIRANAVADAAVLTTTTTIDEGYELTELPLPPSGHVVTDAAAGLSFATYAAAVFDDRDGDERIDAYEFTGHASIWAPPSPRYLVYSEPMGFYTAFTLAGWNWTSGYNVVQQEPGGDPEVLDWTQLVVALTPE